MTHEFRLDEKGRLDEFVAKNVTVHLERMNRNGWWLGITLENGESVMFNIWADKGLRLLAEEDWTGGRDYDGGVLRAR